MKSWLMLVFWGLGLTGCIAVTSCGSSGATARDPRKITSAVGDMAGVVAGNNAFAWTLYQQARATSGNLFFSPFSISATMGMNYAGARGETATQMRDVLHIGVPDAVYAQNFGALIQDLGGPHNGRGYLLSTADGLFGQTGCTFNSDFLALLNTDYGASLQQADFASSPAAATTQINAWISDQTSGRIPQLIDSGDIDPNTRLVIANAIYFKAGWARAFDPQKTQPAPFTLASGQSVTVPMMSDSGGTYPIMSGNGLSAIELPYTDNEVSMVILLPSAGDALDALEASLTPDGVDSIVGSLQASEVNVTLPSWTAGYQMPLKDDLLAMGMTALFDDNMADLSGMSQEPLFVAFAVHKAFVQVDEEGTEASAATATGAEQKSSVGMQFAANHPFVYFIRDRLTGSVLFIGRVADPSQS